MSVLKRLSDDIEISIRKYILQCKLDDIGEDEYETYLLNIIYKASNGKIEFSR